MPSREGYDLFTKMGRKHFKKNKVWRNKCLFRLSIEDTFGKIGCFIVGHNTYLSDGDLACRRCHKYIVKENNK